MFASLLPLLAKVGIGKNMMIAIAAGILVLVIGGFFWSWNARGTKITELQQKIAVLNDTIVVERANTAIANTGTTIVVDRLQETNKTQNQTAALSQGARNVPPTNDAPLAPVIRDVLIGLDSLTRSLREQSTNPAKGPGSSAPSRSSNVSGSTGRSGR